MPMLRVDFVAANQPSLPGRLLLAGAIGLAMVAWQWQSAMQAQTQAVQAQLQQARKQVGLDQPRHARVPASPATQEAMQHARSTAAFLQIPWSSLFAGLEAATGPGLALLSIEPDARKRQLKLTAEASSRDAVFDYMQRLEATPQFSEVVLLKHEKQQDAPEQPWRVVLTATWQEPLPESAP
ncbi:PilN domain-containing protein [Methylovorus menthalis]|uniref:PilN domain-containing protein n=1 Tax=Methylovorus menthalis TaxID=1002227 RepID=UPI001E43577E|nr:PilN domain-containing protein [Methylovorus menthalis]MCB4812087.1 PilN domain-containing protein [Methylovorus menthalis]